MILQHDANGRIIHLVNDPVPMELIEAYVENDEGFVMFSPIPIPDSVAVDKYGNTMFDEQYRDKIGPDGEVMIGFDGTAIQELVKEPIILKNQSRSVECDIQLDYFDVATRTIKRRPTLDLEGKIELSVGETVKLELPAGATIYFDGQPYVIDDGELELASDVATTYQIYVDHFPYLEKTLEVTVHEA